jgi:hypothetical protein
MTDIVPLVSHAWKKSFGVVQNAKTSIANRGWGPLNFVLLDHPDVRKIDHNESANIQQQQTTEISRFDLRSVNTTEGFAGNILDKIVFEHIKDSARIATIKEKKRKMSETSNKIEQLKMLTRIPSGSLAGVGRYHITSDVKEIVKEDRMAKKRKEMEKDLKRKRKKEVEVATYLESKKKFKDKIVPLTAKDMKRLLQFHRCTNDSPIHTKAKELREQFQRRQHRLFDEQDSLELACNDNLLCPTAPHNCNDKDDDDNSIDTYAEELCTNALFKFSHCNCTSTSIDKSDNDDDFHKI